MGNKVVLHCVAQDSYSIPNKDSFTLQDMNLTLLRSFKNFKRIFLERMDLIGIEMPAPMYKIESQDCLVLLKGLKGSK
jgi:hypothetical protein